MLSSIQPTDSVRPRFGQQRPKRVALGGARRTSQPRRGPEITAWCSERMPATRSQKPTTDRFWLSAAGPQPLLGDQEFADAWFSRSFSA